MRSLPAVALLSNGSYGVMITSAGAGYSTWRDLDVTRWHRSATYRIRVDNAAGTGRGVRSVELDGQTVADRHSAPN